MRRLGPSRWLSIVTVAALTGFVALEIVPSAQRSGRNSVGRSHQRGSRWTVHCGMRIVTPRGTS